MANDTSITITKHCILKLEIETVIKPYGYYYLDTTNIQPGRDVGR